MKTIILISLLAGAAAPASAAASGDKLLFNGRDLHGWMVYIERRGRNVNGTLSPDDVVKVDRATHVLHVDGKGVPFGFIRTTKDYTDYRLHLEWRWTEVSKLNNSGLMLRVSGGGADRVLPMHYQVEIDQVDAPAGMVSAKSGDFVIAGYDKPSFKTDPARTPPGWGDKLDGYKGFSWKDALRKASAYAEKPTGEWNSYDVLVDRDRIKVWVNGTPVNEASGAQVIAGGIALEIEGAPIEFRNIRLGPVHE